MQTKLGQWLSNQVEKSGLSYDEIGRAAHISTAVLTHIINDGHIPKLKLLIKLAKWARVSPVKLFALVVDEGKEPPEEFGIRELTLLRRISQKPLPERERAFAYVESLLAAEERMVRESVAPIAPKNGQHERGGSAEGQRSSSPGP